MLAFGSSYFLNSLPNPLALYGLKANFNYGFGPFLSAILISYLYKTPLKLRLFSKTTWIRRIEFVGLGIFFIGTFINAILSGDTNYSLIILWLVFALLYALLEELGWRVFLGNELSKFSFLTVVLLTTVLWFTWHYSFRGRLIMANPVQFLGMIAAGSAGMAEFYRKTKSWLIVALTHAVVNANVPNLPTLIVFLAVIIGLLKLQEAKNKQANVTSQS